MSKYKYVIKKVYQPLPSQIVIEVGDKFGKPVFKYKPGQYAMISYRNSRGQLEDKHAFSLASSPGAIDVIRFGIKLEGSFTRGLLNLQVGDELIVFGPYGKFVYEELKHPDAVMIAGGIGITPFFSALNYANDLQLNNKLALIYSARTQAEALFYSEIKDFQERNTNLKTLFSFTKESSSSSSNTINTRINAKIISDFVGSVTGKTFFICGPDSFIKATRENLLSLGISGEQVKTEAFSMLPDKKIRSRLKNLIYTFLFSMLMVVISLVLMEGGPLRAITSIQGLINSSTASTNFLSWYIARVAGVTAYLLMFLTVILGVGMTTGFAYKYLNPVKSWLTHKYLSLSLGLVLLTHLFSFLLDDFIGLGLKDIFIPFASSYSPLFLSFGIFSFYTLLVIIFTSLWFRIKYKKSWRNIHYATYLLFSFSLVHGFFIGTDSQAITMRALYVSTGSIVLLIIAYRFLLPLAKKIFSRTRLNKNYETFKNNSV